MHLAVWRDRPVKLLHVHVLGIRVAGWMLGSGGRNGHEAVLLQPLDVEDLHGLTLSCQLCPGLLVGVDGPSQNVVPKLCPPWVSGRVAACVVRLHR
jgi:hypothetical protein